MQKTIIKWLFVGAAFFCVSGFAGVTETREALSQYSDNNHKVLDAFDRISSSWVAHDERTKEEAVSEVLFKAVEYAAKKHSEQVRKDADKTPYIIHPIGVCSLMWDIGDIRDVNILSSALLHDTLEDTDATEEEILEIFGERVLNTVKEVTNDPSLSGQENKQRQIDHAPKMSLDGQLVKLADRLYNVIDLDPPPPAWSDEKVDGYYSWGEKLWGVLTGTNEGLENALKAQIDRHKDKKCIDVDTVFGNKKVGDIHFWWDPYEGNYIEEIGVWLEGNTCWRIDWARHCELNISIWTGDDVKTSDLGNNRYKMIVFSKDRTSKKEIFFYKRPIRGYDNTFWNCD